MEVKIKKIKKKTPIHEEFLPFVCALIISVIAINAFAMIQNLKTEEPKPIIQTPPPQPAPKVDNTVWVPVEFCEKGRGMCDPPKVEETPTCPEDKPYYYNNRCNSHKFHHYHPPVPVVVTTNTSNSTNTTNLTINNTAAPIISNLTAIKTNDTLTINWTTDILSNSKIEMGTYNQTDISLVINHSMMINYILDNITLTNYSIVSCNVYSNCTISGPYNIT